VARPALLLVATTCSVVLRLKRQQS
jgi:hypothetical protein